MGKTKLNIPMFAALILLLLTMISFHLTGGLYARYTASATATDSARVAKWAVSATNAKDVLSIDCSTDDLDDEYRFAVTNNSEVSAKYDIVITFTNALENSISLKLDGAKTPTTSDRKTFTFTNVGQLSYGGASADHTLTFTAASKNVLEDISHTFVVRIDFEQID